tara:strand:- start:5537 stop:5737 length:201 start_codon:yes stop_codon:yes gene_type:complete
MLKLKDLIVSINSLYIFVINAMVPPDIPGIKSAIPISIPFRKREVLKFLIKLIKYNYLIISLNYKY